MAVDSARAKSVFLNASDLADPAGRAAYLEQECGGDVGLRHRVDALLRANEDFPVPALEAATIDSDLGGPATEATGFHAPRPDVEPSPISITAEYRGLPAPDILIAGRYTLQEKIGEGGMGEVWVAKQSEPVKRKVALKLIKQGMDSRAVLQRFEQERQALAMMDHPNIAKVFDAGLTPNGQPFFAMELVNGLPLNKFCDEAKLTTKDRLELFVTICQAVQHAHQKGIVHRDLKPANILITIIDGKPVPKVIDFGVAKATTGKLTDESLSTQFGALVGTLEYMSPEQAGFSGEDIDTRADIYSLGVILYEMLTGLRPIDANRLRKAALTEMIRIIREEEPSKPSTRLSTDEALPSMAALRQIEPRKLMALLRGELDWVVMKCLEKHRERRYETASGLARDIQRYLADETVEARPPSAGYQIGKFLKRNKGPVLAASFVLLALVTGFFGTAWGLFRADRARQAEAAQRKIALEQKTKAEASEALARTQQTRAEEREQQAIDAVKKFGDAVANNPGLKNNPALMLLRTTLLKEPLEFFRSLRDRLQAEKDTRPESLHRLARAAFELGALTNEIGDQTDAIRAFQEFVAIAERLARENPNGTRFVNELAASHNNIGVLQKNTGQLERALESFGKALVIQERLARENPAITRFVSDLATSHLNIGVLQSETGHQKQALESHAKTLAIRGRLARENPAVTQFQSDLATSHFNIGVLQYRTGQPERAFESYGNALSIQEALARKNPGVAPLARDLAHSHSSLGILQQASDQPGRALESYGKALTILERITRENPAVTEFASELADSRNQMGLIYSGMGQPERALESYGKALTIRERLARENPAVTEFASDVGGTLNNIAMIDLARRQFPEAKQRLLDAITWQKKALATNPRHPVYREYLQNHYMNLQGVAQGLGDGTLAAEVRRGLRELAASDPRIRALDARLAAVVEGGAVKDNRERLALAQRAYDTKHYTLGASLWSEALAKEPKLGEDRQAQHRYNAACAAAMAGCGQGEEDPLSDDDAKAKLRTQALHWLKAELEFWSKVVESSPPQARPFILQTLKHWQEDTDLAGIRDSQELAKLPEDERAQFKQLWDDVSALLAKANDHK